MPRRQLYSAAVDAINAERQRRYRLKKLVSKKKLEKELAALIANGVTENGLRRLKRRIRKIEIQLLRFPKNQDESSLSESSDEDGTDGNNREAVDTDSGAPEVHGTHVPCHSHQVSIIHTYVAKRQLLLT
jgi:hypothetical protein